MPEYRDGSFGPIKPVEESLNDLQANPDEVARTKMLHIGKFEELVERTQKLSQSTAEEPLAMILQSEFGKLRMDVNKIMIHLGIDDKSEVLAVDEISLDKLKGG